MLSVISYLFFNMANRHLSRSVVLQTLFECDFSGLDKCDVDEVLKRDVDEFAPGMADYSFADSLLKNILINRTKIDNIIEKAAPEWPIDRISIVDRNVLRIGLYELLWGDRKEVPAKVAINEAIELGKTFGGETSGKFVNGVLGAVYKEIGEPGKDEKSKKVKMDPAKFPIERLCGAMVYSKNGGDIYLGLVHDIFGRWTLSKGHLKEEEGLTDGTKRKVKEEMGIDVEIEDELGKNEYLASDPENGKLRKQVSYFLAKGDFVDLKLGDSGGLDDTKWFKLSEISNLNVYDDILPIITKGINILLKK